MLTRGFLTEWSDLAGRITHKNRPESILEIGCGDGYLLDYMRRKLNPGLIAAGMEPGIIEIRTKYGLAGSFQAVGGSIYDLPFDDDAFDLVMVPEVFEHLADPDRGLQEAVRVARRYVMASVPWEPVWRITNMARGKYLRDFGNTPDHVQHFTRKGFHPFHGDSEFQSRRPAHRSPGPWCLGRLRRRRIEGARSPLSPALPQTSINHDLHYKPLPVAGDMKGWIAITPSSLDVRPGRRPINNGQRTIDN